MFAIDPFGELGYQRIFDLDVNTISLRGGLMLSGWMELTSLCAR